MSSRAISINYADNLRDTADERQERSRRTMEQAERQAQRTTETMERTATTLESAMKDAEKTNDPTIIKRLQGIVDYLRSDDPTVTNPLIELLREPDPAPAPRYRSKPK
jgi:hypothetical protein